MYIRFGLPPKLLWEWLGGYCISGSGSGGSSSSGSDGNDYELSQYTTSLLDGINLKYYDTTLPRIPIPGKGSVV